MAGEIKPLRLKRQSAPKPKPSQATSQPVAKVLVDSGLLHIDQEFDFLVPQEFANSAVPGTLVKVPFNRKRDRKSTRLNSSHIPLSRMPSSA